MVDDASDMEVFSAIQGHVNDFADERVALVRLPKNEGGAAARNFGIEAAKGQYIAFLDSDDTWGPEKLENDYRTICSDIAIDILYSPINNIENGKLVECFPEVGIYPEESISDYLFSRMKGGRGMQTSTLVVRAELARRVLFNPALRGHQDWDFLLRLGSLNPRVRFIEICMTDRYLIKKSSDHKNVSLGLSYSFSKKFLEDYRQYMSKRSVLYFRTRVLLRKSIIERNEVLRNIFFWGNLLDIFWIIKSFKAALSKGLA